MEKSYSIAEARDNLAKIVHEAESGKTVKLMRRGKTVAVLLSQDEYQQLRPAGKGFWKATQDFRAKHNLEGLGFTDADFEGLRDKSPGRDFKWPA